MTHMRRDSLPNVLFWGVVLAFTVILSIAVVLQYLMVRAAPSKDTRDIGEPIVERIKQVIPLCSRNIVGCEARELFVSYHREGIALQFCGATWDSFADAELVAATRAAIGSSATRQQGRLNERIDFLVYKNVQPCKWSTKRLLLTAKL